MTLQKQIHLLFLSLLCSVFSMAQMHPNKVRSVVSDSVRAAYSSTNLMPLTDSIINYGKLFLHTRYRHGSSCPTSFDCSGFTSFVYRNFGYNLSRSSSEQANQINAIDRCDLRKGDLVFFSGRFRSKHVGHVGMVVSADGDGKFNFIHASTQNGVIISNSEELYYNKRFIKAGRVINDNQLLAVVPNFSIPENKLTETVPEPQTLLNASPVKETTKVIPAEYHRVKKGETLSTIAHKYGLTLAELKQKNNIKNNKINPKQRIKIKDAETILLVEAVLPKTIEKPVEVAVNQPTTETKIVHIVQKGETLFSISKLYNITVDELKKLNNILKGKIHFGQKLKLNPAVQPVQNIEAAKPEIASVPKVESKPTKHKVISGETLFSIAKMYDVSVDELKKTNNLSTSKIKPGQEIKLIQKEVVEVRTNKQSKIKPAETKDEIVSKPTTHKVKSGESFYTIAKIYGCKIEELKDWNKKSGSKIKPGEKLIVYQKAD